MRSFEDIARALYDADLTGVARTPPSAQGMPADLSRAYEIQQAYVTLRSKDDPIAGFKAGLTAPTAQQTFGLDGPVSAVLFSSGARDDGARLPHSDYRKLMLETEIGFRIKNRLDTPVSDVDAMKEHVAAAVPCVELADLSFGDAKSTGFDLVAGNVAASGFITGAAPSTRVNINMLPVALFCDDALLQAGAADEVMGDQWQALVWLVNAVIDQGYVVEPGHLMLTGAIGGMQPGRPGRYVADFEKFGRVSFDVVE